jgi:predicted 3-demethylubiquinone-9 3-methyltransferase (glyoxalase superfamily)
MPTITPFLWFDNNAEEAVALYKSVFKQSSIQSLDRAPDGKVLTVSFQLEGQAFIALNGGPGHRFTDASSLFISCETQAEVDALWEKLSAGGEEGRCGWLKDKYGLSWQVVPTVLGELLGDPDRVKAGRVMQAMLQMQKLDIQQLRDAYNQP